jgi:hypothetical protein
VADEPRVSRRQAVRIRFGDVGDDVVGQLDRSSSVIRGVAPAPGPSTLYSASSRRDVAVRAERGLRGFWDRSLAAAYPDISCRAVVLVEGEGHRDEDQDGEDDDQGHELVGQRGS